MALFTPGMPCPYCGNPMGEEDDLVGFTFVGSRDPLLIEIDDGLVHRDCLGPTWLLEVAGTGQVQNLSWWGFVRYYLRRWFRR